MANEGIETLEERMQRQGMPIAVEGAKYPGEVLFSTVSADSPTALYKAGKISREEYDAAIRDIFLGTSALGGDNADQGAENEDGGGEKSPNEDAEDTKSAAAVLIIKDGYILCADRKDGKGVCGPGGHIQEGETPEQAAVREAQEEFNITPLNIVPYGKLDGSTGLYRNTTLYFTDNYDGEPQTDGEEMSGARWVSLGELRKERLFRAFWDGIQIFLDAIKNSENPLTNTQLRVTINTNKTPNTDGGPGSGFPDHRGRPGHKGGALPRLTAGVIAKALEDGVISKKLDRSKQLKHYKGTRKYNKAVAEGDEVSYFTVGMDVLKSIISENAGKGQGYGDGKQYKEVIDTGKVIGVHVAIDGTERKTTKITVHYAKDGCHAVPASPRKGD